MTSDPRKRQKKLERKTAARKQKKKTMARLEQHLAGEEVASAAQGQLLHCTMGNSIEKDGIGAVTISRTLPNGSVGVSVFLVDKWCLGVKDAYFRVMPRTDYDIQRHQTNSRHPVREVAPEKARKYVECAVEYAQKLGFPPPPDYQIARVMFGDIDASKCKETFEFGKDGKPFYANGPSESAARVAQIMDTLRRTCGEGGFHFLLGGPAAMEFMGGEFPGS